MDYSWAETTTSIGPTTVVLTLDLKTSSNNTWHAHGDTFSNIEAFVGSKYKDSIQGGDGDDILSGYIGGDTIRGGAGDDTLWGRDPGILRSLRQYGDSLHGEAGDDKVIVGRGDGSYGGAGDDKFLMMGSANSDGGDGTDEFYFHRNYFPTGVSRGNISNHESKDKIWICMGSGEGDGMNDSDGEVSWTKTAVSLSGDNMTKDTQISVKLQIGTASVSQGTILVIDEPDVSNVTVKWSDPDAEIGTGCNFVYLESQPDQTRMIRSEVADLLLE